MDWITSGLGMLKTFIIWAIALILLVGMTYGSLKVRKKRKLKNPVLIETDIGEGKLGVEMTKGGWFKSKSLLWGLYDYAGNDVFLTKDGRNVQEVSASDYHEINGKRGVICRRKGDDPKILVPITKVILKDGVAIDEIAPANFRDASASIMAQNEEETKSVMDKILPAVMGGIIIIGFIIALVVVIKFANGALDTSKDVLATAGNVQKDTIVALCKEAYSAVNGVANVPISP